MRMFSYFTRSKVKPLKDTEKFTDNDVDFSSDMAKDAEFSSDMTYENRVSLAVPNSSYSDSGVYMTTFKDSSKLTYDGLLADSGADGVYAVVDYGSNFKSSDYYPMTKTNDKTFEVQIPITNMDNISVSFKDSANNWDNNNGVNYTFSNSSKGSI